MLIGRLAVAQQMQGRGIGKILVKHALKTVVNISEQVGVYAIRIDPIDEEAKNYYAKIYGFFELRDTLSVYLPISTIKQALTLAGEGA